MTLKRRIPLRANPDKVREWKARSRTSLKRGKLKPRSTKRARQEKHYLSIHGVWLLEHPTCPVTGEPATQVHHSAKREGEWLNLRRYWIGVSAEGHRLIEDHKETATALGLMVRIRESYRDHVQSLLAEGQSLTIPIFYENWNGQFLQQHFC